MFDCLPSLKKEEIEKYRQAGQIARQVMRKAKKIISKGKKLEVICDSLEREIFTLGGKPAFPVNIGINQIAAHYTSPKNDDLTIPERAIIKIDCGAHIDGYISDHARSFLVGGTKTYQRLRQTAELALEKAIEIVKPGIRPSDIGEVIENTIVGEGLTPITDLTGHMIERWKLHTGISIPNFKPKLDVFGQKFKEGQVIAIEPFVTTEEGSKQIKDHNYTYIFAQKGNKAKSEEAKKILEKIKEYNRLPFASRWLYDISLSETKIFEALKELISLKSITRYPILVSKSNTPVAQAEHTVLLTSNGCEVTTRG